MCETQCRHKRIGKYGVDDSGGVFSLEKNQYIITLDDDDDDVDGIQNHSIFGGLCSVNRLSHQLILCDVWDASRDC